MGDTWAVDPGQSAKLLTLVIVQDEERLLLGTKKRGQAPLVDLLQA